MPQRSNIPARNLISPLTDAGRQATKSTSTTFSATDIPNDPGSHPSTHSPQCKCHEECLLKRESGLGVVRVIVLDIGGAIVQPAAFCGFGDGGGSRVVVLSLTLVGVERSRMTGEISLVVWTRGILLDVKDRHGDIPVVLTRGGCEKNTEGLHWIRISIKVEHMVSLSGCGDGGDTLVDDYHSTTISWNLIVEMTIMPLMVGTRLYHSAIYGIHHSYQTWDRKNGSNNPVLISGTDNGWISLTSVAGMTHCYK
ncbi:hypothetical protein An02g01190 [Aspergillus niger]|uniref:Uncharacterized protein n=2 Tax=Aspergillus niger TaxID=5061 RepID=A2QBT8_ASPNC|nr:hypothetical protein An02g01190 [Aspergillus niger]CAK96335.1 hypothetical protein An02g01190 [Aspergillus niger]